MGQAAAWHAVISGQIYCRNTGHLLAVMMRACAGAPGRARTAAQLGADRFAHFTPGAETFGPCGNAAAVLRCAEIEAAGQQFRARGAGCRLEESARSSTRRTGIPRGGVRALGHASLASSPTRRKCRRSHARASFIRWLALYPLAMPIFHLSPRAGGADGNFFAGFMLGHSVNNFTHARDGHDKSSGG